jgi:hypothetical protein
VNTVVKNSVRFINKISLTWKHFLQTKKTETILSMNGTILLQSLLRDRSEKAKAITFYAQLTISKNVELNRQFFFSLPPTLISDRSDLLKQNLSVISNRLMQNRIEKP